MKILKWILIVIAALVLLFLIIGAVLPAHYRVERSIEINAPVDSVFKLVSDYKHLYEWNPWSKMDAEAINTFSEKTYGVGAVWSWEGKIIGKGSLTISEVVENKIIKSRLEFLDPQPMISDNLFEFYPIAGGVKVVWADEGKLDFPISRYFGLFLDSMMGPDFEKGLINLKQMAEK